MPRAARDRAATSTAKKDSEETSFTVRMSLLAASKICPPAARSAAEAVSEVLREGVISHSILGRLTSGKNLS